MRSLIALALFSCALLAASVTASSWNETERSRRSISSTSYLHNVVNSFNWMNPDCEKKSIHKRVGTSKIPMQGLCGWGKYLFLSHGNGGRELLVISKDTMNVVYNVNLNNVRKDLDHIGSCQASNDILVVAFESESRTKSEVHMWRVFDNAPPKHLDFILSRNDGAAAAGITPINDGKQWVIGSISGYSAGKSSVVTIHLDVVEAASPYGDPKTSKLHAEYRLPGDHSIRDNFGLATDVQNHVYIIGLAHDCSNWLSHHLKYSETSKCVHNFDGMYLFEWTYMSDKKEVKEIAHKGLNTRGGAWWKTHLRWGAGVEINDGIAVYATERGATAMDSIDMDQWIKYQGAGAWASCQQSKDCIWDHQKKRYCHVGDRRCLTDGECKWANERDHQHRDCGALGPFHDRTEPHH